MSKSKPRCRITQTFFLLPLVVLTLAIAPRAGAAKKFKRALVISAGGITPGVSLGIIAAAQDTGYKPDVIIAVCGATLGTAIANSYPRIDDRIQFARSEKFHQILQSLIQIDTPLALALKFKFDYIQDHPDVLPAFFDTNILRIPEQVGNYLPHEQFSSGTPRFIFPAARANFGPQNVGADISGKILFRQVFFTDRDTARALNGMSSTIKKIFPQSRLSARTETITHIPITQASRAAISDPDLVNPARIDGSYYFTGGVDLFPIETALALADEVLVTYPVGKFTPYEDLAISSAFGFSQNARTLKAIQQTHVKWIDVSGMELVSFDPTTVGPFLVNNVPVSAEAFAKGIDLQYSFGYWRTVEALKVQAHRDNVRTHLRAPLK